MSALFTIQLAVPPVALSLFAATLHTLSIDLCAMVCPHQPTHFHTFASVWSATGFVSYTLVEKFFFCGSIPMAKPKSNRGKDRHATPRLVFHASQELVAALAEYQASSRPPIEKSACLRTALEDFLKSKGFWPPQQAKK